MKPKEEFAGHKKVGQSILGPLEKRLVAHYTPKIPKWLETWTLTSMTIYWSLGVLVFGYLARFNIHFLWGTSLMIFLQYVTDLFDGAVGRYRNTGLVKWGYYADHFLDYIFMSSLLIGYSFFIPDRYGTLFAIMMIYGGFMVNSFISFAATNRFEISYFGFGPTEARIGFIVVNTMLIIFGKTYLAQFLPVLLAASFVLLCVVVFRNQKLLWDMDMEEKRKGSAQPSKR
jgi:archaetidylinositol phosphate synthase